MQSDANVNAGQPYHSRRAMREQAKDLHVGVDVGTKTLVVSWMWSTSREKHILKFKSPSTEKTNEELDATLARSRTKWFYGPDARHLSDVVVFENIKLGIIGQDPYLSLLKGSILEAGEDYGITENPVTLFEQLFLHILDTLEEQIPRSGRESTLPGRPVIRRHPQTLPNNSGLISSVGS